ncbi:glycosyltransferase [Flavobacterium sp. LC2016-01]|uniref:glycosyltransferase n=1 Tax=Flavobacterium sp. LC2016-01 TaxID=2675876 RepID=UPI0012BA76C6|nr:glycosyltransferase [Flavobacterium sp. LC2016-01]MTH17517.1 glycosyltransferase [Flavobacterium sp. LC2016-01]
MTNSKDFDFSVLMPLFFKEKPEYIEESLKSLYNQTLKPTEIILVQEGVLNEEQNNILNYWIKAFGDEVIRVVDSKEVKGLAPCLNLGLHASRCNYIARFDSDDICFPDRFEKQIEFLKNNNDVVILGGQIEEFDEKMEVSMGIRRVPVKYREILSFAKWRCPFNHQTVFYKRDVAIALGGYPIMKVYEDYSFWGLFLVNGHKAANLPDVLVKARTGEGLITRRSGMNFLKGELTGIKFLYKIKFLSTLRYYTLVISRIVVRSLPTGALRKIYTLLRKRQDASLG